MYDNLLMWSKGSVLAGTLSYSPKLDTETIRKIMSRHGLGHRLVDVPVADALTAPWYTDDPRTEPLDKKLKVKDRLYEAVLSSRAYGGAWLWPVYREDEDFRAPLKSRAHLTPTALHVITAPEGIPSTWDRDISSENFGRPLILDVTFNRDHTVAATVRVHTSRLIYVPGVRALPDQTTENGYDISVLQLYYEALASLDQLSDSAGRLISRMSFPVLTMPDGKEVLGAEEAEAVARLELFENTMHSRGIALLLGEDTLDFKSASISGLEQLIDRQWRRISSVEGIPQTRLGGESPTGFSTDDAAGQRSNMDFEERTRTLMTEALEDLYELCLGTEVDVGWGLKPSDELSEGSVSSSTHQAALTLAASPQGLPQASEGVQEPSTVVVS